PPPTLSTIAPTSGTTNGGAGVTLTGTNFASGATITFGGVAATGVTFVNSASLTANTPAHAAGAVDVIVTNPDTQSATLTNGYTYDAQPTVTNINSASGPTAGNTSVTITGTNFINGATVTIGGVAATNISVANATTITATTPAHAAGATDIVVTTPGGN